MKKVAILQSNYIPWKGYFGLIERVDEFVILDEVQYTKNDWRNRNKIKGRSGGQWLTIPVRQEQLAQRISEVKIQDHRWSSKHWNTLAQNYSKAKYFKDYSAQVESIYLEAGKLELLSDVNQLFLKRICSILALDTKISNCTDYEIAGDRVDRLVNLCRQTGADVYLSGPAAKDYLDEAKFSSEGVTVEWMSYSGYPVYEQLFPPFEHGVTILDLLFSVGPRHRQYMQTD